MRWIALVGRLRGPLYFDQWIGLVRFEHAKIFAFSDETSRRDHRDVAEQRTPRKWGWLVIQGRVAFVPIVNYTKSCFDDSVVNVAPGNSACRRFDSVSVSLNSLTVENVREMLAKRSIPNERIFWFDEYWNLLKGNLGRRKSWKKSRENCPSVRTVDNYSDKFQWNSIAEVGQPRLDSNVVS